MAPKQALGIRDLDERTDDYALGATLYELLTGDLPPKPATIGELVAGRWRDVPEAHRRARELAGHEVEMGLLAALQLDPERRPATAGDAASNSHATECVAQSLKGGGLRDGPVRGGWASNKRCISSSLISNGSFSYPGGVTVRGGPGLPATGAKRHDERDSSRTSHAWPSRSTKRR